MNEQSRETGNVGFTKNQRMDNSEKRATLGLQDTERRQTKQKYTTQITTTDYHRLIIKTITG